MADDGYTLDEIYNLQELTLRTYDALKAAPEPEVNREARLEALLEQIHINNRLIEDFHTAEKQAESDQRIADVAAVHQAMDLLAAEEKAAQEKAKEAAKRASQEVATDRKEAAEAEIVKQRLRRSCGMTGAIGAIVVLIFVVISILFFGNDDDEAAKCSRATTTLGGVQVRLVADCDTETPTPTESATEPNTTAPATGMPDAADLPPGQVLYQGTSGRQIGCIACDGQSRFISIDKSTTALGDANRAVQEIVWPQKGDVVDFGIQIPQPNEGRYGINLFVNGAYSVGCPIETGSSSCRVLAGQEPSPLAAGDRVTIIVGEQGLVDKNGVPVEEGDFVLEWWFVFQPE